VHVDNIQRIDHLYQVMIERMGHILLRKINERQHSMLAATTAKCRARKPSLTAKL
jgi:thiamine biosynthesis protein ThiC